MNQHFRNAILAKIKPDAPYAQSLRNTVNGLSEIGEMLDAFKQKYGQDNNYSEVGRRAALADTVRSDLARRYASASGPIRRSLKAIASRRKDFTVPAPDQSNIVQELQRQEIRSYLRGLPVEERPGAAIALANDPELGAAIYHAPAALCGMGGANFGEVFKQAREIFHNKYVAQHFAKPLAELEAAEVDHIAAKQILDAVRSELQQSSGLTEPGFAALLEPLETAADKQTG